MTGWAFIHVCTCHAFCSHFLHYRSNSRRVKYLIESKWARYIYIYVPQVTSQCSTVQPGPASCWRRRSAIDSHEVFSMSARRASSETTRSHDPPPPPREFSYFPRVQ